MNRIKFGPLANRPTEHRESQHLLLSSGATVTPSIECALFIPMHYEDNYSYPLIVWLHRGGGDQRELLQVIPQVSARNFVGIAVKGPDHHPDGGRQWLQSSDSIESTHARVQEAVDRAINRVNIDRSAIFIAGQGSGGTMAFRLAFQNPQLYSGVASINGSLPCNLTPLANWWRCRRLPVFWAHGRVASSFPESNLCHQLKLLHVAGFAVTLRQYPCAEETPQAFQDLNGWIMDLRKSAGHDIVT